LNGGKGVETLSSGQSVNVETFEVLEDFKGFIFTLEDIKGLKVSETNRFWLMLSSGEVEFLAGAVTKKKGDSFVTRVVHKKRLDALGLPTDRKYYRFTKKWKDPKEVELQAALAERKNMRHWEIRTYADGIDRRVEEAEKSKERRERRKLDYEFDDKRGWKVVTPEQHKKARRAAEKKQAISAADWDIAEKGKKS
jgi:hypothetical protein